MLEQQDDEGAGGSLIQLSTPDAWNYQEHDTDVCVCVSNDIDTSLSWVWNEVSGEMEVNLIE